MYERNGVHPVMRMIMSSVLVMTLAACTHEAFKLHARAAAIASVVVQGAGDVVEEVVTSELQTECPSREDACIARVGERWSAVRVGYLGVRTAVVGWVEAIRIASAADSGEGLEEALMQAAARMVHQYQAFAEALGLMGVSVPMLPPLVVSLAEVIAR